MTRPRSFSILVVEDDPLLLMDAVDMFEDEGFVVQPGTPTRRSGIWKRIKTYGFSLQTSTCPARWMAYVWPMPCVTVGRP